MARQYWLSGNHGDPRREERVVRLCRRAVEIDPDYARAWALMALAQVNLRYAFDRPDEDGVHVGETCALTRSDDRRSALRDGSRQLRKG